MRSAPGKIRTCDLSLRRRALYPLSYGRGSPILRGAAPSPEAAPKGLEALGSETSPYRTWLPYAAWSNDASRETCRPGSAVSATARSIARMAGGMWSPLRRRPDRGRTARLSRTERGGRTSDQATYSRGRRKGNASRSGLCRKLRLHFDAGVAGAEAQFECQNFQRLRRRAVWVQARGFVELRRKGSAQIFEFVA